MERGGLGVSDIFHEIGGGCNPRLDMSWIGVLANSTPSQAQNRIPHGDPPFPMPIPAYLWKRTRTAPIESQNSLR
jgi:hypothetical protein